MSQGESIQRQTEDNPLLDTSGLPRFAEIRAWHVAPAVDAALAAARAGIEGLLERSRAPAWNELGVPLQEIEERLDRVWSPVAHLNAVLDSDALRAVYEACLPKLSAWHTEMGQHRGLFERFRALADSDEHATLSAARRRVIHNALRDFRLSGIDLDESGRARFKDIQQELSTLGNRFEQNLLDATDGWFLHLRADDEIAGLPESALAAARAAAGRDRLEGWKFTLHGPSYVAFMTHAERRDLRQAMYEASVTRASETGPNGGRWDNGPVMVAILRLRRELAALLGYRCFADYSLETKMAESVDQVESFLTALARRARPAARAEFTELEAFARERDGLERLEAWDVAYYAERLRQQRFRISQEDVRPYFPLPKVLDGVFAVVNGLFGVTVRPLARPQVWHEDVRFFEIVDQQGEIRGRFYVDLYAREHKRGGAWMGECVNRRRRADGEVEIPVAYVICNFGEPVASRPSLLSHDEVVTLFHEFGHALHHLLTTVDEPAVAGINGVAWDAVELPSQFLENWCWEREALNLMSGHWESGGPLPDELLERLRSTRDFQAGMQMVRQLEFALFDLRLHGGFAGDSVDAIQSLLDRVRDEVAVIRPPACKRFQNTFSHIFGGGYAAGYYSYKWAEVLSADAFAKFEENGIFDRGTGEAFLHAILEPGGSREPMDLFREFRGREPSIEALLRHAGLA